MEEKGEERKRKGVARGRAALMMAREHPEGS